VSYAEKGTVEHSANDEWNCKKTLEMRRIHGIRDARNARDSICRYCLGSGSSGGR
jgi:hypothetical protein